VSDASAALEPYHARLRQRAPGFAQRLVRIAFLLPIRLAYRVHVEPGPDEPAGGPVIYAANHGSWYDQFFLALLVRRRLAFMAMAQLFRPPLGRGMAAVGAFPVRRGERDDEAVVTALAVLERGDAVVIFPAGRHPRGDEGPLDAPIRSGVGRLALESGAPVVPVAIVPSAEVKRTQLRPWSWPRVTVRGGPPLRPGLDADATREDHQRVAEDIGAAIAALYG
jgi:1-acyl-sn-glycerol-3-phosphate acyltransferase